MAGLVGYASSDEEDGVPEQQVPLSSSNAAEVLASTKTSIDGSRPGTSAQNLYYYPASNESPEIQTNGAVSKPPQTQTEAPLVGPVLPPTTDLAMPEPLDEDGESKPQSPYSANRALLRDLTLPTIPNYNIPPSPPGSPVASTNAKFKHFLDLKKQGVHFNEKLANSTALKNPSLMQKLMDFSDIDEVGQYATTLPKGLWNPNAFPDYAFKEELAKSQQKITKRKEEEKLRSVRESVDFVPATVTEPPNRTGTPGTGGRGGQKSAAERIMAGLDRGRSSSPQVSGQKRKTRFDS